MYKDVCTADSYIILVMSTKAKEYETSNKLLSFNRTEVEIFQIFQPLLSSRNYPSLIHILIYDPSCISYY